jgi:hypothetical protein
MGNWGIDPKRLTAIMLRTIHLEFAEAFAIQAFMCAGTRDERNEDRGL